MSLKIRGISGWLVVFAACLALVPAALRAQVGSAALSGVVQDTTGAIVPGATATITNTVSGAERVATANGEGLFSFSAVLAGDYTLTIAAPGFKDYRQTGIHLNPGDNRSLPEISLTVGPTNETVTVQENLSAIPLDSGSSLDHQLRRSRPALDGRARGRRVAAHAARFRHPQSGSAKCRA